MKALTFTVRFQTAQFRAHHQKLTRRTYLIPPPSAVAGLFGAIIGVPKNKLKSYCKEQNVLAGAELRNLGGYYTTLSRTFKFDCDVEEIRKRLMEWLSQKPRKGRSPEDVYRDVLGLVPLKQSEELLKPEYKFAVAAKDKTTKKASKRIKELDFEHDIFGGNDYHFVDYIGDVCDEARLVISKNGRGYCPRDALLRIESQNYKVIIDPKYSLWGNVRRLPLMIFDTVGPKIEAFAFVYGANIITNVEIDAVQDMESTIFVYDPTRCLVP